MLTRGLSQCSKPKPGVAGHTLVELVVVLTIASVLSGATVGSMRGLASVRQGIAAARVRTALVYAQELAMSSNTDTWAEIDTLDDEVTIFVEDPSNPGSSNRLRVADPLTRKTMRLQLAESGVGIEAVDLGGTAEVQFDQSGLPYDQSGAALVKDGTITLTGDVVVRVTRNTGLISID